MDPSSGRDKNSNPPSEAENPFIRFKNFADSQVSSLLQGIIGLPSAISRRSAEQNRWGDIDEDLRRRDQLQARQAQLKDAAEKTNGNSAISGEIPVKKSPHYEASQTSESMSRWKNLVNGKQALNGENNDYPKASHDLPLYSPVTKELFENFNPDDALFGPFQGLSGFSAIRKHDFGLPAFDPMIMIKDLSLTMLRISTTFHSEYSLLPYLLSSPYSPIKLETEERMSVSSRNNRFQYCAAFEDLIRTSQGRESSTRSHDDATRTSNSIFFNLPGQAHWFWLLFLQRDGILQQKRQGSDPVPDLKAWKAIGSGPQGSELDMFEHVQRFPQFSESSMILRGLFNGIQHDSEDEEGAFQDSRLQAARNSHLWSKEDLARVRASVEGKDTENDPPMDKVVTTHTTTERTTHEDGTVETTLTIWKQFEDGRESTTTTHHIEEPAWSDRETSSSDERTSRQVEKDVRADQKEKKGWFWN